MSLLIRFSPECPISNFFDAAHEVYPSVPPLLWGGDFVELVQHCLEKRSPHDSEESYNSHERTLTYLRMVQTAMAVAHGCWVPKARAFIQEKIDREIEYLKSEEWEATPESLRIVLEKWFGKDTDSFIVPGRGLQIRLKEGAILSINRQKCSYPPEGDWVFWYELRHASFSDTIKFLEKMVYTKVKCYVAREGVFEFAIDAEENTIAHWQEPQSCIYRLKEPRGRKIAHRKFPLFNEKGQEIPA